MTKDQKSIEPASTVVAPDQGGLLERAIGSRIDSGWAKVDGLWGRGADVVRSSPVGRWWTGAVTPGLVDWSLLAAMCAVAFVTFLYGDVRATFEHSFNFMDALLAGRPQDFYQIAIENSTFGHPAVYDIPIYLIFGLWNLPSYIAYRVADYDYLNSLPSQLWLKAMMVVFSLMAAKLVFAIAKELGLTAARAKWAAFYFLSAVTFVVPVLVIVQYDIISVAFMLAGVLAYMRGRTRSFLLWFLAANTLKLFSVFVFIPLVLLREKRLPRAAAQLGLGLLGLVLCRLLYHGNVAYEISTGGFTSGMMQRLVDAGFTWRPGLNVPLFAGFMVCLVIFSYAKRITSDRELKAFAVYLPLATYLVFCALVPLNPYWIVLVAPFAVLIIFANPRFLTLNSLLEVGIGSAIVLTYTMVGYSMYNAGMFQQLAFGRLVPPASPQRFGTPAEILAALGVDKLSPFLIGFFVAATVAVLVLNFPRRQFIEDMPNVEPIRRSVVWIRLAAPAVFMLLLFAFYLLPGRPTAYSSYTDTPVPSSVNVVGPGVEVTEVIQLNETVTLHAIGIGFDASAVTWINSASVNVSLTDSSGNRVFETRTPANALGVGVTTLPAAGVTLQAGESYTLSLSGQNDEGEPVFVLMNPAVDSFVTTENGQTVPGDLVLTLVGS